MDVCSTKTLNLQKCVKILYNLSGQFNLYIDLCYNENDADVKRLKEEIDKIKQIVMDIENKINNI